MNLHLKDTGDLIPELLMVPTVALPFPPLPPEPMGLSYDSALRSPLCQFSLAHDENRHPPSSIWLQFLCSVSAFQLECLLHFYLSKSSFISEAQLNPSLLLEHSAFILELSEPHCQPPVDEEMCETALSRIKSQVYPPKKCDLG